MSKIDFQIKNRFSGEVQFTANIDCEENESHGVKLGLAVKWGIKNKVSLTGADLTGADLTGVDLTGVDLTGVFLRGADLTGVFLRGAVLTGADLTGADLRGVVLRGAVLRGADLTGADLTGVVLRGAVLTGVVLRGADLTGADLRGVVLTGADLTGADLTGVFLRGAVLTGVVLRGAVLTGVVLSKRQLRNFKHDFWGILLRYQSEIAALKEHIKQGKIDGSVYSGTCACLMGTIANIKHCDIDNEGIEKDSSSDIESWFMMINAGDTPETNQASKLVLEWLEEFEELSNTKAKQ